MEAIISQSTPGYTILFGITELINAVEAFVVFLPVIVSDLIVVFSGCISPTVEANCSTNNPGSLGLLVVPVLTRVNSAPGLEAVTGSTLVRVTDFCTIVASLGRKPVLVVSGVVVVNWNVVAGGMVVFVDESVEFLVSDVIDGSAVEIKVESVTVVSAKVVLLVIVARDVVRVVVSIVDKIKSVGESEDTLVSSVVAIES